MMIDVMKVRKIVEVILTFVKGRQDVDTRKFAAKMIGPANLKIYR